MSSKSIFKLFQFKNFRQLLPSVSTVQRIQQCPCDLICSPTCFILFFCCSNDFFPFVVAFNKNSDQWSLFSATGAIVGLIIYLNRYWIQNEHILRFIIHFLSIFSIKCIYNEIEGNRMKNLAISKSSIHFTWRYFYFYFFSLIEFNLILHKFIYLYLFFL